MAFSKKVFASRLFFSVAQFLYQYRSTPHSTTGRSPAELFIGRPLRNHVDLLRPDLADQVEKRQRAQKQYAERGTRAVSVQKGDTVWVTSVDRLQGATLRENPTLLTLEGGVSPN